MLISITYYNKVKIVFKIKICSNKCNKEIVLIKMKFTKTVWVDKVKKVR